MSLRQRNKRRNKSQENIVKPNFCGCSACGSEEISRSPTGDWCNICGRQWPCSCQINDHKKCFDRLLEKSKANNLNEPASCCCGKHK
jgi:hypothetical protein